MMTKLRPSRKRKPRGEVPSAPAAPPVAPAIGVAPVDIAPDDPLMAHLRGAGGPVDVAELELDSPALRELKAAGVRLAVPLVSQGELIGVLNLGPRLSDQDYSSEDRKLLDNLAAQAAPALRVGQLVREQEAEAVTRQRYEQELEVARLIQQNFLPRQLPELDGWEIAAYYRPAREVGGDFYDVIALPGGQVAFVIGDVTDKGVPAALVMSATRSVLRGAAQRLTEPGAVLEHVNEHLCPDIPDKMFVTCLYGVLDPETGRLRFANAGHDVPYVKTAGGVAELRARGMPLGLMPGMHYEEKETILARGETVLLHSDGIVEAHDRERSMFGFPGLKRTVADGPSGAALIQRVLDDVAAFTGPDHEQEDDITMLCLHRSDGSPAPDGDEILVFDVASAPGNERGATERVQAVAAELGMQPARVERLGTAVAEATMNAMEHGNRYDPERPVTVRVLHSGDLVRVQVSDYGGGEVGPAEAPDIEAKLDGRQSPRGWGLFLIEKLVDETRVTSAGGRHTLELGVRLSGGDDDDA